MVDGAGQAHHPVGIPRRINPTKRAAQPIVQALDFLDIVRLCRRWHGRDVERLNAAAAIENECRVVRPLGQLIGERQHARAFLAEVPPLARIDIGMHRNQGREVRPRRFLVDRERRVHAEIDVGARVARLDPTQSGALVRPRERLTFGDARIRHDAHQRHMRCAGHAGPGVQECLGRVHVRHQRRADVL
jgi:hypothetical protein